MANDRWYIIENGSHLGPYTWSELRDRARKGLLTATTPVTQDGSGYAMPAGRLRVLFARTRRERIAFLIEAIARACFSFVRNHRLVISSLAMLFIGYCLARSGLAKKSDAIEPKHASTHLSEPATTPRQVAVQDPVEAKPTPTQPIPAVSAQSVELPDPANATLRCWNDLSKAHAYAKEQLDQLAAVQPLTLSAAGETLGSVPSVCSQIEQRFRTIDQANVDSRLVALIDKYANAYQLGANQRRALGSDLDRLGNSDFCQTQQGQQLLTAMLFTIIAVGKKEDEVNKDALALRDSLSATYHVPFEIPSWIPIPGTSADQQSQAGGTKPDASNSRLDGPITERSESDQATEPSFSRGSTINDVEAIEGRPTLISSMPNGTEERYYHDGEAIVVFRNGTVESWSDPSHHLRVVTGERATAGNAAKPSAAPAGSAQAQLKEVPADGVEPATANPKAP